MSVKYQYTVELEVDQIWIDDGFEGDSKDRLDQVREFFECEMIPYAVGGTEMKAKVTCIKKGE